MRRGPLGGFMVCYQVFAQFTFHQHKPALVSTHIKKQHARPFLVMSSLPSGHSLKYRRFFHTEEEAARYVSHLYAVYKGRIITPATDGGCKQVDEFLRCKNSKLKIRKDADFQHGGQLTFNF
jgi:hypothetical protein